MKDKDTFFSKKNTIRCKGEIFDLSEPKIMGILNVTPDSFYDGGKYISENSIIERVEQMVTEGADFIDIGACSSRPGAMQISRQEEIHRLDLALKTIRNKYPDILLSVDTFRAETAEFAVKHFDVNLVNDISAGEADAKMFKTVADLNVPYIMMHMKGTPHDMQKNPAYDDVMKEIFMFFSEKINKARLSGIIDIIIDPGFGFGKTIEHNYKILSHLDDFKIFNLSVMVGMSRKSMIYKLLHTSPEEALNGTTVVNSIALIGGADILRVHDVKEAKETVKLVQMIKMQTDVQ